MWHDLETDVDYLNFEMLVDSVYDTITEQYDEEPLSFGISGSWGTGKSSFAKQLKKRFEIRSEYIICDFNAWLYQGFEDSKIALLKKVSDALAPDEEAAKKKWNSTINTFLSKFRKGKNFANATVSFIPGLGVIANKVSEKLDYVIDAAEDFFLEDSYDITANIENFRKEIENILKQSKRKLIVFIDDLDRCLPDVALETLEAMRLLLFVKRTVFIIAADKRMIEKAVEYRFGISTEGSSPEITRNYFDKLIQTPIDLPVIGQSEAVIYLLCLLSENYYINQNHSNDASNKVKALGLVRLLDESWKETVTSDSILDCIRHSDNDLFNKLGMESIVRSLVQAIPLLINSVYGNPRLLKRFLHTYILANRMAKQKGIPFRSDIYLMLLAIERSNIELYRKLSDSCRSSNNGHINFDDWETVGKNISKNMEKDVFSIFENIDLRPYFYLSRVVASQILQTGDPVVFEIFTAIKKMSKKTMRSIEKDEINKLNTKQLEMLSQQLMIDAKENGYEKLYFYHLLYIDSKIKSDEILRYFTSVPLDKVDLADRRIFESSAYKNNIRYDSIRARFVKKQNEE